MFIKSCMVVTLAIFAIQANGASAANDDRDSPDSGQPNDNQERLLMELNRKLMSYNPYVEPSINTTVGLWLRYMCPMFNEETRVLKSRVWLALKWNEPMLTWDPAKYGGIKKQTLPYLWKPDIMLHNSIEGEVRDLTDLVISNDGNVLHVTPATWTTICSHRDSNSAAYSCALILGSWTYDGDHLPLQLAYPEGVKLDSPEGCGGYWVEELRAYKDIVMYPCCVEKYHNIRVQFKIRKMN